MQELVDDAVEKGATVAVGGQAPGGPGNYPATVLTNVPPNARILKEEVFGPVAPIVGFDTEEQGIAAANDTEYGLAAYIWTQSLDRALRVAESVQAGMVGVNRGVISGSGRAVRRRQGVGFGTRGRLRGHRRVPGHRVHRADAVAADRERTRRVVPCMPDLPRRGPAIVFCGACGAAFD